MKRLALAASFVLLTCGVSTPCLAQTQFHWAFDKPVVPLPSSGHHVVTATLYNTGTTALSPQIFSITTSADFRTVASNITFGPTPTSGFVGQFTSNPNYPVAPGTSLQFAAFNFDYNGPGGVYADVLTDSYLQMGGVRVAPSNNITFSFTGGAVPEPATWALMILGFGLIGAAMRRRRAFGRGSGPAKAALSFAALCAAAAAHAEVAPVSGGIANNAYVNGGGVNFVADDPEFRDWTGTPQDLAATTVATYLPASGGLVGASQTMDAKWASATGGSLSVDWQSLIFSDPAANEAGLSYRTGINSGYLDPDGLPGFYHWRYAFIATTDMLLTVDPLSYALSFSDDDTAWNLGVFGSFTLNGQYLLGSRFGLGGLGSGPLTPVKQEVPLFAGQGYLLDFEMRAYMSSKPEMNPTAQVMNGSVAYNWSITDRIADPGGDPGGVGAVPEPGIWLMMIAGFGLIGAAMRTRRRAQVAFA